MINPEAMIAVMLAATPPDDLDDRYERLFTLRDEIAQANADGDRESVALLATQALVLLKSEFSEPIEAEDFERAEEIISGLYLNPREIDDLSESEIGAIEDTAVCAGFTRTMMRSYGIDLSDDPHWLVFIMRYRRFLA